MDKSEKDYLPVYQHELEDLPDLTWRLIQHIDYLIRAEWWESKAKLETPSPHSPPYSQAQLQSSIPSSSISSHHM